MSLIEYIIRDTTYTTYTFTNEKPYNHAHFTNVICTKVNSLPKNMGKLCKHGSVGYAVRCYCPFNEQ